MRILSTVNHKHYPTLTHAFEWTMPDSGPERYNPKGGTAAASTAAEPARTSEPAFDVSVVVAAWNASAFLDEAIDSVLGQEGVSVEVVVSDDASTDDTAALSERRARADERVRILRAETNGGPSAARNRAIAAASGRWIAVLDADDRFAAGRLARLVAFAEAEGADVVLDNLREADADGQVSDAPFLPLATPERWSLRRWAEDNRVRVTRCTGFLKPLLSRDFLLRQGIRYREEMRNSEDYALVAECLAAGARVFYHPEPGYLYRRRRGSISHRYDPTALDRLIDFSRGMRLRAEGREDEETLAALDAHLAALLNARALEAVVAGLKDRAPVRAGSALVDRPQALGLFLRWTIEALGKRALPAR